MYRVACGLSAKACHLPDILPARTVVCAVTFSRNLAAYQNDLYYCLLLALYGFPRSFLFAAMTVVLAFYRHFVCENLTTIMKVIPVKLQNVSIIKLSMRPMESVNNRYTRLI